MIKAQPLPYEKDLFTPVLTKETLDFHGSICASGSRHKCAIVGF